MSQSNAYVEAFLTKKPKDGINVVQGRLKDIMTLDTELAEYFRERAEIEETYAKNLSKASKRLYTTDPGVLGHFAPVWDLLLKEYNQIANYHSELAYKINQQIEKPLRSPPCDDYDKLQQPPPNHSDEPCHSLTGKQVKKGSIFKKSSAKPANWENEGVEYLNLAQGIDEARLNRLKSSVEQFERIQCDQLQKRMDLAYMTLSTAKKFDTQHDIRDFCSERGRGLTTIARPHPSRNISHDSLRSTTSSTNKFKSVFMKKKRHSNLDTDNYLPQKNYASMDDQPSFSTNSYSPPNTIPVTPVMNETSKTDMHLVDSEGYSVPTTTGQFPTITSDISSRNTSDDVDSDFQSLKLNQKLQIDIKDSILKEEASESNESFTKVASMLRERTPIATRKLRGRREGSMIRSQTESSLYSTYNDSSNNVNRSNSMLSMSSLDAGNLNPFLQQQQSYAPIINTSIPYSSSPQLSQHSPITLVDSPMAVGNSSWLQPILEDQHPEVVISIQEKTSMPNEHRILKVKGQVSLTYTGPTNAPISLTASLLDGIQQLIPDPRYITVAGTHYKLNTLDFPQNQPTVCFTYEVELNGDSRLPIKLTPSWKCIDGVSYLMLKHSQNQPIDTLKGSIHVFYDQVTNVQSTPQGTWDTSKNRLTWYIRDLVEQYAQEESSQPRLLAKFFLREGEMGTPQPIYFNYLAKGTLATGFSIRVLDDKQLIKQHLERSVQSESIVIF